MREREREIGNGQWGFEKWVCGMGLSKWWVRRSGGFDEWVRQSEFDEWVFWVSGFQEWRGRRSWRGRLAGVLGIAR